MGRREEYDRGLERTKTENLSKNGPQIRSPLFFVVVVVVVRAISYTLVRAVVVVEVIEVVVQRHLLLAPSLYYICLRLLSSESQIY